MSENNGNGYATADDLLATTGKRRFTDFILPVCGAKVRIRSLTTSEIEQYQAAAVGEDGKRLRKDRMANAARRFIVLCVVDGDGNLVFKPTDIPRLGQMDGADCGSLYEACAKHCGIKDSDMEGIAKNSEETAADGQS